MRAHAPHYAQDFPLPSEIYDDLSSLKSVNCSFCSPAALSCFACSVHPFEKPLLLMDIWVESWTPISKCYPLAFNVSLSANMKTLSWFVVGAQNHIIQLIVDFLWNIGVLERELDLLNDMLVPVNPRQVGHWIQFSDKGGTDGGWFVPADITLERIVECFEHSGVFGVVGMSVNSPFQTLRRWAITNNVMTVCHYRRNTSNNVVTLSMSLPGWHCSHQLALALSGFAEFGFPPISNDVVQLIQSSVTTCKPLQISVAFTDKKFASMGLTIHEPTAALCAQLSSTVGGRLHRRDDFEKALGVDGPLSVEYHYLMNDFAYDVYQEGFDVVFHYSMSNQHKSPSVSGST